MTFSKQFYDDKVKKLQAKANANLQGFLDSAFKMVAEANDIAERINEVNDIIIKNKNTMTDETPVVPEATEAPVETPEVVTPEVTETPAV